MIHIDNLYKGTKPTENYEIFSTLFHNETLKIESIRSNMKRPGELYDQDQDEWVLLLEGEAQLEIADEIRNISPGDYLFLPKHTLHRVISTSENALWLCIFSS
ncbi:MAG: cupin domain-containing protein [Sulfuricurvum sp.]|uniref:cupin domain-containing protein n=1 Tax=Sulfuricurvum sp. TaxID=2025608 RepID=UPI002608BF2F|nr:cupin domain-containing protein [Sulfuricurvum sp.]MDD2370094.1 cupin domain-containing protein [Sulfuricurvum sp.]MDD2949836.1 cupin domain-containing protein [Sulfuricurvum sp.]MDD5119522.1 cupin domain-containing protein [Sulfuricurvum sp.]